MSFADAFPPGAHPALALPARHADAWCPAAAHTAPVGAHEAAHSHAGDTARGRPPSPYIGARTIVAMQWVVFGSCMLQWALS